MKKGKSKSSSNTWRLVSLQLCRFSIPMPEKLRFRREIVPIIQLMALLQSFLEKNESISEIICLSLTIAFSIESFLIALKDTHFLRNTELKAILFYLRNLNNKLAISKNYEILMECACRADPVLRYNPGARDRGNRKP